jgi:hypothetical protein
MEIDDSRCYVLATALENYLTAETDSRCACAAFREQFYAWIVGEPAPPPMQVTDTPCAICSVLYEAFQSVLTDDALLELTAASAAGNRLAIVLNQLLPIPPSRLVQ